MNDNESVNLRHLEQVASGDLFETWLTKTLEAGSITATDAAVFTRDYRVPVVFSIYESEKKETEDSLIVYEVNEYSLWAVINGAFGWPTSKDLMTNSCLRISVRYPEFISSVVSTLNKDSFFNYLNEQLTSIPLPDPFPATLEDPVMSGHVFSKSAQTFSMVGIKLCNQDIYIKLSARGERVIEDLYISLYEKYTNYTDWLCAVAAHVYRSMTFLRLHSVQDNPPVCPVATATSEHDIWVSQLAGEEVSITVSLIDRWQPLSINMNVPAALSESAQVEATVRTSVGTVTRYLIAVPPKFRGAQDWPFYVATYINHRIEGLAYGVLQDDGAIVAMRPGGGYRIYAWHDSEINSVEFKAVDKPLTQWLNTGDYRPMTVRIAADSIPMFTAVGTSKPSIWEALSQVDGKRLDARPYLEQLIWRCLDSGGLDTDARSGVQLTSTLIFKYLQGNTGFVHAAGAAIDHVKRNKFFTVLQVALGEHERHKSLWEREIDVYSKTGLISRKVIAVIKTIRDKLSGEFYKDIDKLSNDAEFSKIFETTCKSIVKARVALYLDAQPEGAAFNNLAADYLTAKRAPQLVVFNQKIIPSLVALASDSETALLVSINPAQLNATTVIEWNANQDSDAYLKKRLSFIEPHLSLSEQLHLTIADLRTLRGRTVAIVPTSVSLPRLSFQTTLNWEAALRWQAIVQAKSDINFLVFSSREQYAASRLRLSQTALRAVSAMVTILLPPTLGVSAVVAYSLLQATINSIGLWSSVELANNADRGTDYKRYIDEGKLGALLLAAELLGDASSLKLPVGRLIRQISGLARAVTPMVTDQVKPVDSLPQDLATAGLYFQSITSVTLAPRVADLVRCLERSEFQLAIAGWIKWPHGNAYDASSLAKSVIEADGWEVEVLGVLMFAHPSSELPAHHFALLAKKSGTQIVVDLTMAQYSLSNVHQAYAGSLEDWEVRFATLEKNRTRVLLYKRYPSTVAGSDEMGGWARGGVAGDSRFIDSANYTVGHFPALFAGSVDKQLERLWKSLNSPADTSATKADSLKQISHLMTLRSSKENELRIRIGLKQTIALRKLLLNRHYNAAQSVTQLQLKIEADIEVERVNIEHVTRHLSTLKRSALKPPSPPVPQALASAVAWLVATGLATRSDSDVIARVVQSYITGDFKTFVFYSRSAITALHRELTANPGNLAPSVLRPDKLPTAISSRALQDWHLKKLEAVTPSERGEHLFAIIMCCPVYENGNELLARTLYAIEALRQQRFVKLTVSYEQYLAGIVTDAANHS